jgi:hypothetical protein
LGGSSGQFDPNTLEPFPFGGLHHMAPSAGEKAHNGHGDQNRPVTCGSRELAPVW